MKFRTDFVTNSSSNSYIVNLSVKPRETDKIELNLYPDGWDDDNALFRLRSGVKNVAERVKDSKTVSELAEVMVEESFGGDIQGILKDYEEYEDEDSVDLKDEVQRKIIRFI